MPPGRAASRRRSACPTSTIPRPCIPRRGGTSATRSCPAGRSSPMRRSYCRIWPGSGRPSGSRRRRRFWSVTRRSGCTACIWRPSCPRVRARGGTRWRPCWRTPRRIPRVVVSGDMNNHGIGREFVARGFRWPTEHNPHTEHFWNWDHIFLKGLALSDSGATGVVRDNRHASDHKAVWAVISLVAPSAARTIPQRLPRTRRQEIRMRNRLCALRHAAVRDDRPGAATSRHTGLHASKK